MTYQFKPNWEPAKLGPCFVVGKLPTLAARRHCRYLRRDSFSSACRTCWYMISPLRASPVNACSRFQANFFCIIPHNSAIAPTPTFALLPLCPAHPPCVAADASRPLVRLAAPCLPPHPYKFCRIPCILMRRSLSLHCTAGSHRRARCSSRRPHPESGMSSDAEFAAKIDQQRDVADDAQSGLVLPGAV